MGHYEGMEELIYAEREERSKIVNTLSAEQFVKAYLLDEKSTLEFKMKHLKRQIKENQRQLSKLEKISLPASVKILKGHFEDFSYKFRFDKRIKELLGLK